MKVSCHAVWLAAFDPVAKCFTSRVVALARRRPRPTDRSIYTPVGSKSATPDQKTLGMMFVPKEELKSR